ncbi:MAG: AbrB/MazE/SpoVT family DNA-binding domain-containing protein [Alphaproteobacteria bacterium]|jgi:AbrB family looped-hinge helix DNA binding protein
MRITSKGQVTIPARIRESGGLLPNTEVDFVFDGSVVRIIPNSTQGRHRPRRRHHSAAMGDDRYFHDHRRNRGIDAGFIRPVLADSNVIPDVAGNDKTWQI